MDVTLELHRCTDIHPEFIDIQRDSLDAVCKAFGIPIETLADVNGDQWMRLYSDGSYDVLISE